MRSIDEIIVVLGRFTDEQRSLAWSPMPFYEPVGPHDCRIGANCGVDFSRGSRRARWVQARHRWNAEERSTRVFNGAGECHERGTNGRGGRLSDI
jgi:hypothetical protein